MIENDSNDKYKRAATVFAALLGGSLVAALVFYFLFLIEGALLPFFYAAIIVYFARPFVEMLADRKVPRTISVFIAYLIVFVFITLIMVFVIPLLVGQTVELARLMPRFLDIGQKYFSDLRIQVPANLDVVFTELQDRAQKLAVDLASAVPETVIGLFGGLFNIILAWLLAFYILKDLPAIKQTVSGLIPDRYRANVVHAFREVDFAVGGYLRGQVIVAAAVGLMIMVWLGVLGVRFAFLLGLLAGILNIIPYFGATVAGAAAAVTALVFGSVQLAVIAVGGIVVIQQIEAAIISPLVMRQTVNLHPTVVVFSLLTAAALFGFLGLLLAIPVAAALKAILLHYVLKEPVETAEKT